MGNQNGVQQQKAVKGEKLLRISDKEITQSIMHRSIGALTFVDPRGKSGKGSAVLISSNLILTAAHNIFNKQYKKRHTDFKFYLAPSGIVQKYYEVSSFSYFKQYQTCPSQTRIKNDFALMKLKETIRIGSLCPLYITCQECKIKRQEIELQIYGYPFDHSLPNYIPHDKEGKKIELYQFGLTKSAKVVSVDPKNCQIDYAMSTFPGQSGCPIVSKGNIIGIHIGAGSGKNQFNKGRLITVQDTKHLNAWCKQMNADFFTVNDFQFCYHLKKIHKILLEKQSSKVQAKLLSKILTETFKEPQSLSSNFKVQTIQKTHKPQKQQIASTQNISGSTQIISKIEDEGKINKNLEMKSKSRQAYELISWDLSVKNLSSIDVRNYINLKQLWLNSNKLVSVDLTNNVNLTHLWLNNNLLTEINLSKNVNLISLSLDHNRLIDIDLASASNNLTQLWLNKNQLAIIILKFSPKISKAWIDLSNQRSISCMIRLLYEQDIDFEECNQWRERISMKYKFNGTGHQQNSKYIVFLVRQNLSAICK